MTDIEQLKDLLRVVGGIESIVDFDISSDEKINRIKEILSESETLKELDKEPVE